MRDSSIHWIEYMLRKHFLVFKNLNILTHKGCLRKDPINVQAKLAMSTVGEEAKIKEKKTSLSGDDFLTTITIATAKDANESKRDFKRAKAPY